MNRDDLKELARIRLKDARVLLENGNYEGAYYLCGYIIECALKACIAKQTKQYDFPDKNIVNKVFTHKFEDLVGLAGLKRELEQEKKSNRVFQANWVIVTQWSAESRYERYDGSKARDLYSAITNRRNGVLRWIRQHW